MYASRLGAILTAAQLTSRAAFGNPILASTMTDSALTPWVSVDASGNPVATITPIFTSVYGAPTTVRAAPTALTATATPSQDGSNPTETSKPGGGAYYLCHNLHGDFRPFCTPTNGSVVYVGTAYYVTWDSEYFSEKNASIYIMADYVNSTGGPIAFQSSIESASTGFLAWTVQKEWLQDQSSNNITLFINPIHPNGEAIRLPGPNLMVTNEPPSYYRQPPTEAPTGQSLYIALPVVFGFILACVCGGYFLNRKHRQIGLGSVMGRRRGYGVGKSRRQRLGIRKPEPIQLRDQVLSPNGRYRDAPVDEEQRGRQRESGHRGADSDLGSLTGSPTAERTNYFRDGWRQEQVRP